MILSLWMRITKWPCGRWLFSRLIGFKAPYFSTIKPHFQVLRPGYCEVTMKKRRAVLNHIGTVHAIAMCNLAELVAGTMTDASIPKTHRWIPKGMTVEYVAKARTDLRAVAELNPIPDITGAVELPVDVKVLDSAGNIVLKAEISMWVSPSRSSA